VALVHHGTLREPGDLAVLRQHHAQIERVLEGSAHEQRVLHARAVVGEQVHAGGGQLRERRELLAQPADRDRSRGSHVAQPGALTLAADELDHAHRVLGRVGVRHRDDTRVAALRGRA
jgi:hypothetical protein